MSSGSTLQTLSRDAIVKGSKSFSLASFFFGVKEREASHLLYHFCRYCDDVIDHAESREASVVALAELYRELDRIEEGFESEKPALLAFGRVSREYAIPMRYARDLLAGFETDTSGAEIKTEADLELYSYRVAGVVGLMMCHVMGVSRREATSQAIELGLAMQMTNIARDVREDFERNRVYLPSTWLIDAGVNRARLLDDETKTFKLVERLLALAKVRYESGLCGLSALPLRAAIAVSIAAAVYAGIGKKVLRRGPKSLRDRTYLTSLEKAFYAARGLVRVIPLALVRALSLRSILFEPPDHLRKSLDS